MNVIAKKTATFQGKALIPGSKSLSIRNIFIAMLARGTSSVSNFLASQDTDDALNVCKQLGFMTSYNNNTLSITHSLTQSLPTITSLQTGNSGITTRFVLPYIGLTNPPHHSLIINCGEQMRARPIEPLVCALNQLGMDIQYMQEIGRFPLRVSGQLLGGFAEVDGITSQYISALLLSLPCAKKDSVIRVKQLHERPYMEMTLDILDQHQINYKHVIKDDNDIFYITGNQRYKPFVTQVTGDFSSASYIIAAAALLPGETEIMGLNIHDSQGDKKLLDILVEMGADIQILPSTIKIKGGAPLKGIKIDANAIPDLLPTLAVVGTQAAGKTILYNVPQARIKETDRIHSMTEGLQRLGAKVEEHPAGMTIYQSRLQGNTVEGYDDHRTVMALTLAGLLADGTTLVKDAEAINKTFPEFITILKSLTAKVELEHATIT